MKPEHYEKLTSDEVFLAGVAASDVRTMWRSLARSRAVREVGQQLASDPSRIRALCRFVEYLLSQPHDDAFRHPSDIAACAGLVILEQSPLPEVRRLFARLRAGREPSLFWVREMADYCEQRVAGRSVCAHCAYEPGRRTTGFIGQESPGIAWADPELEPKRYSLQLA